MSEVVLRWRGAEPRRRPDPTPEFGTVDVGALPPDPQLAALLPARLALDEKVLPWRRIGAETVVLAADPAAALSCLPALEAALGPVRFARAEPRALQAALSRLIGRPHAARAERRLPALASCRSLPGRRLSLVGGLGAAAALLAAILMPLAVLAAVAALASLVLLLSAGLRLAAIAALLRQDRRDEGAEVLPARLPVISLLIPLYREPEIGGTILSRIAALDYPREFLDLCLILEDDDELTRRAVAATTMPSWAQVIVVPEGTIRTKPRALNYALDSARGSVIGIYDAEDLPAPDHLRRVAGAFARRGPRTACLQGALDYFNAERNWMARCFTLEYASWFRVILPGLERLGLALPLGGTTLFLRREALEAAGGWDAHNVTEDADLGIRLARHGYLTEMIPIVTQEEANARPWPWVRQRSRWLKGYAVTWAVHMRDPVRLWRELGPRRFWGFQLMFLGTIVQFALAPVLWSFWLASLGLVHPLAPLLGPGLMTALLLLFLAAQAIDIACAWMGARRAGKERLAAWAPTLLLYFPLATLALYRATWEVVRHPYRWDKTTHGIDLPPARRKTITLPLAPSRRRAAAAS